MPLRGAWLGEALETLADNAVVYRVALAQGEWPEKCPDCDDRRKVRFTSPQGHEYSETCDKCGNRIVRRERPRGSGVEGALHQPFQRHRGRDGRVGTPRMG